MASSGQDTKLKEGNRQGREITDEQAKQQVKDEVELRELSRPSSVWSLVLDFSSHCNVSCGIQKTSGAVVAKHSASS